MNVLPAGFAIRRTASGCARRTDRVSDLEFGGENDLLGWVLAVLAVLNAVDQQLGCRFGHLRQWQHDRGQVDREQVEVVKPPEYDQREIVRDLNPAGPDRS